MEAERGSRCEIANADPARDWVHFFSFSERSRIASCIQYLQREATASVCYAGYESGVNKSFQPKQVSIILTVRRQKWLWFCAPASQSPYCEHKYCYSSATCAWL